MATVAHAARPPLWRNVRVLRFVGQAAFILLVVIVGRELILNLDFGVREQGLDLSFDFLRQRAGFPIGEGIAYSPNESFVSAFLVGLVNTIRVAVVGIVLATLVGVVMGVARLSSNWLVRKVAQVYVEIIRNTPVLVQIIFWWGAVVLALPVIGGGFSLGGVAYVSNRGTALPWFRLEAGAGLWALILAAGAVTAALAWRWRTRANERTGEPPRRVWWSIGVFLAIAVGGLFLTGTPIRGDVPQVGRFGYAGGIQFSPEYTALLLGLVIYTAAFIAEIIRGSIQAVSKGQKEAAEALGLTPGQQLRLVVLPQALRIAIPPLNSQYLNLTKNSSLALAIGYPEIVQVSSTIINQAGRATQILLLMMATYLVLTLTISFLMNLLNRAVTTKGTAR
ncbi:MAG TPA: ABC transporter permease subunit [Actinomycetota bacterium]|nr:ABC transporter permease subunit [Actinomycetota bacterium]